MFVNGFLDLMIVLVIYRRVPFQIVSLIASKPEAWIDNVCVAAQTNVAFALQKGRSQWQYKPAQSTISLD